MVFLNFYVLALTLPLLMAGQEGQKMPPPLKAGTAATGKETVYAVISPVSKWGGKVIPLAPRLDTLEGKTIAEVGGTFKGPETFAVLEELLKQKYPGIRFIPLNELRAEGEALGKLLKSKGADAVIAGNGC